LKVLYGSDYAILAGLIGLFIVITIFIMAYRLKKLVRIAEYIPVWPSVVTMVAQSASAEITKHLIYRG
jgi:hypothetical protein